MHWLAKASYPSKVAKAALWPQAACPSLMLPGALTLEFHAPVALWSFLYLCTKCAPGMFWMETLICFERLCSNVNWAVPSFLPGGRFLTHSL